MRGFCTAFCRNSTRGTGGIYTLYLFTRCKLVQEMIDDIRRHSVYYVGPDCVLLVEELSKKMALKPGMRILDMGCGAGFTSIILAKEFGVTVFANDLWFSASDNYRRLVKAGVEDRVFPIQAEAHDLPYADGFLTQRSVSTPTTISVRTNAICAIIMRDWSSRAASLDW